VSERRVALLRGINVGRAKRLAMADLRALVEDLGYGDVRTLLNSGNIIFTVPRTKRGDAAARIEKAIASRLGVSARVYVLTAAGYFKSQMAIYVMDLLIVASLCVVLIPQLGISGSAVAMLVSQLSQVVLATVLIWIVLRKLGTSAAVPPFDSDGAT